MSDAPRRIVQFRKDVLARGQQLFDRKAMPQFGSLLHPESALRQTLTTLLEEREQFRYTRVFGSITPEQLDALAARAENGRKGYVAPDFDSYYFVEGATGDAEDEKFFRDKRFADVVSSVGRLSRGSPPTDPASVFRWDTMYSHFHDAPEGTGAKVAWEYEGGGGEGDGMRFADIEEVRPIAHACLPEDRYELVGDEWRDGASYWLHATAVLGIVLPDKAGPWAFGGASNVEKAFVVSNVSGDGVNTLKAIEDAASLLRAGDVLLIEYQAAVKNVHPIAGRKMNVPVEIDRVVYEAILKATNAGIIVIEPGGNGADSEFAQNIDVLTRDGGTTIGRDPTRPALFRDSGAIIVSASQIREGSTEHERRIWAPYGTRVDCFARGKDVSTCRNAGSDAELCNQPWFTGTSAAAAIIAATALQLQGIVKRRRDGTPLSPRVVRHAFRNSDWGTSAVDESGKPIGVMPDLEKLIEHLPEIEALSDADCET